MYITYKNKEVAMSQWSFFLMQFSPSNFELTKAEHCGKKGIAHFKHKEDCVVLIIVLYAHREHVQEDQRKDGYFKSAI